MKKDPIDRLFEEKLKDFSEVPDPRVWNAVESSLDNRRKSRKAIPFWWKFAGVAAVLLIGLYLFNPMDDMAVPVDSISDTKEVTPQTPIFKEPGQGDTIVLTQDENSVATVPAGKKPGASSGIDADEAAIPNEESPNTTNSDFGKESDRTLAGSANNDNATDKLNEQEVIQGGQKPVRVPMEVTGIPVKSGDEESHGDQSGDSRQLKNNLDEQISGNIAAGGFIKDSDSIGKDERSGPAREKVAVVAETGQKPETGQPQKKSLYDEIAENEKTEVAESTESHWSAGPRVAPVYFNSFGQGSPIHSDFVSNSKSGNISLSYGIALNYSISPKLSVRSGINKVDYGYDTNDISFTPSLAVSSSEKINNIDYSLSSRNLIVRNSSEARAAQTALAVEVAAQNPERDGRMVQQFGYIEVPLEINYALIDRKLGIHLIGGLSSLFLVDNSVILVSNGNSTEMGAANNLNALNFSTNFGVGVQYELTSKLQLNLEPVFKYQLNTFSDAAGNFSPYSIGIYSGLNFKF